MCHKKKKKIINKAYHALHEQKTHEVETLLAAIFQFSLRQQIFPETPATWHMNLLHSFQQIVELRESIQIMKDLLPPTGPNGLLTFE